MNKEINVVIWKNTGPSGALSVGATVQEVFQGRSVDYDEWLKEIGVEKATCVFNPIIFNDIIRK